MKRLVGSVLGLGIFFGAAPAAQACCDYGCCDCSCIAAVPAPDAQKIMAEITELMREQGINPQAIDLVVKTDNHTVVLHQTKERGIEQPRAPGK